ncbi:MAG: PilZ domain-containing protein [Pseudomonadota bacterium]
MRISKVEDRRNISRWQLLLFLPVFDSNSDELFGYVADITTEGLLVLSKKPIDTNQPFDLEIRVDDMKEALLYQEGETDKDIKFTVQSRWAARDKQQDFYRTGLMFVDLPPQIAVSVRRLVRIVFRNTLPSEYK